MAVVELDIPEFRIWFPGLTETEISDELLEILWDQACEIVGNDDSRSFSPYDPDAKPPKKERKILLYYALCHFATLHLRGEDSPGRVASASEGSVSVTFDPIKTKSQSQTSQWWNQTQCGATYWTMTAKYRLGGRFYGAKKYHPWG